MPIDSHLSYLEKHALLPGLIVEPPDAGLGLVAVVFCDRPDHLWDGLRSLIEAVMPPVAVEVLVVFHLPNDASMEARTQHAQAKAIASAVVQDQVLKGMRLHVLDLPDVVPQDFGDGLTRKLAFDEALRRLQAVDNTDAPIAWLDAGVLVGEGYLTAVHRYFREHRNKTSCTTGFQFLHDAKECTLRYALRGLRTMRHPHAFYHMASVVVVRGSQYARESGMNRRKVGADFHFLHKLTPLGLHGDCPQARLIYLNDPQDILPQDTVFAPAAYHLLRDFAERVLTGWQQSPDAIIAEVSALHPALATWLATAGFRERLAGMQASATQAASFRQRFFRWFSVLQVQHFMNFAHPAYFERVPLGEAIAALIGPSDDLLSTLRMLDRQPYSNSL